MKVTGYGNIRPGSGTKKTGSTSSASSSFADILALSDTETAAAAAVGDVAAADLSSLLSLQEISEGDVRRKKLLQQGANMLDELEKLRQHLLMGTLPAHLLRDLERQLLVQKQTALDPMVGALVEEIELRVAVELAKLERARRDT